MNSFAESLACKFTLDSKCAYMPFEIDFHPRIENCHSLSYWTNHKVWRYKKGKQNKKFKPKKYETKDDQEQEEKHGLKKK